MKLPQPAQWEVCSPEFAKNFTGVGYFFAREIHRTQKIPIGIIHSSVGATYAEAWVSREALQTRMPYDFPDRLADVEQATGVVPENYNYFADIEKWAARAGSHCTNHHESAPPSDESQSNHHESAPGPVESRPVGTWEPALLPSTTA